MQRTTLLAGLLSGLCTVAFVTQQAAAQAPEMSLTRLECGTPQAPTMVNQRFSDTYAHGDLKVQLVYSCYLIKHGNDYMVWDTGFGMSAPNTAPKVSLIDQLAQLKVMPEQVKFVGISHYHGDHVGQAGTFAKSSTLLIGKGDWDVLSSPKPPENAATAPLAPYLKGEGKVEPVPLDKDVFGDGSVVMISPCGFSASVSFAITGTNDNPTVTAGTQSATLVESGVGTTGTSSATITLTAGQASGWHRHDAPKRAGGVANTVKLYGRSGQGPSEVRLRQPGQCLERRA